MTDPSTTINQPGAPGQNTGHGRVYQRPDGVTADCEGARRCHWCRADVFRRARVGTALERAGNTDPLIEHLADRIIATQDGILAGLPRLVSAWKLSDDAAVRLAALLVPVLRQVVAEALAEPRQEVPR